jgi:pyruvate formate lyase activating enzyme
MTSLVTEGMSVARPDPVEKKPLYHYLPKSLTFSIGSEGCNFSCIFCQNSEIAHGPRNTKPRLHPASPAVIVAAAESSGSASIAFTYNEPTVFFELMAKIADMALYVGLGTILVSNGYQSGGCLKALSSRIQAANIDLKSFRETFYRNHCKARLKPVLRNLRHMARLGWWLEITTLVIEGENDSQAELSDIASFISNELGRHVPWHISAFHPCYNMQNRPRTSAQTLEKAFEIGKKAGLQFVYTGNTPNSVSTYCPNCNALHMKRQGHLGMVAQSGQYGICRACGHNLPGMWSLPNNTVSAPCHEK